MNETKGWESIRVGSGLTVHWGRKAGSRWVALCGAGANRTGRNVSGWGHPLGLDESGKVVPVTCKKCLAKQYAQEDKRKGW